MASGDTLATWNANDNQPPLTSAATQNVRGGGHVVLDFDQTTNENAIFKGVMPSWYSDGGTTVRTFWTAVPASGDIDVQTAYEDMTGADVDSDGFASAQSTINTTVPGTSGVPFIVSVTHTDGAQMDSVIAGDQFRLRITRDAATDTAAGDAELHSVEIQET